MDISSEDLKQRYSERPDSDLLELYSSGTLTDLAYDAIENELIKRDIQIPKRITINEAKQNPSFAVKLLSYWNGNAPLYRAFWLVYFLGIGLVRLLSQFILSLDITPLTIIAFCIFVFYLLFSFIAVWRCAWNTKRKMWGYISRVCVLLTVSLFFFGFIHGFVNA